MHAVFTSSFLLCLGGEIKGSEIFLLLIFTRKNWFLTKHYTSFTLEMSKCCYLPEKLGKHMKFEIAFFVDIDEISAIF